MNQIRISSKREYGLDIFRTLSMLFVIFVHILGHGGLEASYAAGTIGHLIVTFLQIMVYPAVNCFVLLSGYLLSEKSFRISRLLQIWLSAVFWSFVIQCAFYIADPSSISIGKTLFMFFPILNGRYWFLNAYVVMFLASPFLNYLLDSLPLWKMKALLFTSAAVFCIAPVLALNNDVFATQNGYSFPWFLVLYLTGGYIKKYVSRPKKGYSFLLAFLLLCILQFVWIIGIDILSINSLSPYRNMFMKYTSVLIYGEAVCLMLYFRAECFCKRTFLSRVCSYLSPMVFSVYLIHDHPLIRTQFITERFIGVKEYPMPLVFFSVVAIAFGIFFICILLDLVRYYLFLALKIPSRINHFGDWLTTRFTDLLMR